MVILYRQIATIIISFDEFSLILCTILIHFHAKIFRFYGTGTINYWWIKCIVSFNMSSIIKQITDRKLDKSMNNRIRYLTDEATNMSDVWIGEHKSRWSSPLIFNDVCIIEVGCSQLCLTVWHSNRGCSFQWFHPVFRIFIWYYLRPQQWDHVFKANFDYDVHLIAEIIEQRFKFVRALEHSPTYINFANNWIELGVFFYQA